MKLRQYRKAKGLTQEQFAKEAGVSQSYLSEIENGGRPGFELAARIERITNGEVPMASWITDRESAA